MAGTGQITVTGSVSGIQGAIETLAINTVMSSTNIQGTITLITTVSTAAVQVTPVTTSALFLLLTASTSNTAGLQLAGDSSSVGIFLHPTNTNLISLPVNAAGASNTSMQFWLKCSSAGGTAVVAGTFV